MGYFFLSYARLDSDQYLKRFFQDLESEVRGRAGLGNGTVGFFDTENVELGETWPAVMSTALQTSRVLVSLFSASYFQSEYCGREWEIFRMRQQQHLAGKPPGTAPPAVILPVFWQPLDRLPKGLPDVAKLAIGDIQNTQANLGSLYEKEGLRYLMRLRSNEDAYNEFVTRFADRVIQAGAANDLPSAANLPPIKEVRSAFHAPVSQKLESAGDDANVGPRFVRFIFAAGNRTDLRTLRATLDAYGDLGGLDWKPFNPTLTETIGLVAQNVANSEQLYSEVVKLEPNLIQQLDRFKKNNDIVVMVVDPWSMRMGQFQALMNDYDSRLYINCVVLIPWNSQDNETQNERLNLEGLVRQAFPQRAVVRDPDSFVDTVQSLDDLKKQLALLLNKARSRIMSLATVYRRPVGMNPVPKPVISANAVGANSTAVVEKENS